MARIVMDALSHQAIRALGTEAQHYQSAPERTGLWRGVRLTGLEAALTEAGHAFAIAPPSAGTLADAAVLLVASRSQSVPFTPADLAAIEAFVTRGGGLWLMANHRNFIRPQQELAAALNLPIGFNDLSIVDYPDIEVDAHPIGAGCGKLHVRNTTSLFLSDGAERVASFSADSRHVFAAATTREQGRVFATGDSGFLASLDDARQPMFATASNARFFRNAIDWLLGR